VYLEELFFSQKNPQVVDSVAMKNGAFSLKATAKEQGMYRIRLSNSPAGFLFINDKPNILFSADMKDVSLNGPSFNSPANVTLKGFIAQLEAFRTDFEGLQGRLASLQTTKGSDSLVAATQSEMSGLAKKQQQYLIGFIDSTTNPVMAMFALSNTRGMNPETLEKPVMALQKRFADHAAVGTLTAQFSVLMQQQKAQAQQQTSPNAPNLGSMAPELTMPDVNDKPFSLSALKGKYVLVDFWASWCGPCRREFNALRRLRQQIADTNLVIISISVDAARNNWIKALREERLPWPQLHDNRYKYNIANGLFGVRMLPTTFLIDRKGRMRYKDLKGTVLSNVIKGWLE
jgi:peroxiredoxin